VDASTKFLLDKGSRLQKLMIQAQNRPVDIVTQIILLYAGLKNLLNDVNLIYLDIYERKMNYLLSSGFF